MLLSTPALAVWKTFQRPAVCNLTTEAFDELKDEKSQPIIVSKFQNIDVIVWVSPHDEITVTNTMMIGGQSVTCIVAVGEKDTIFIERTNKPTY